MACSSKPEPKVEAVYHMGDKVRLIDQFYERCYGIVIGFSQPNYYRVEIICPKMPDGFKDEPYQEWLHYADIAERLP